MDLPYTPGTFRRLKIAVEVRQGLGLPRLPEPEFARLVGLLATIRDAPNAEDLPSDAAQESKGRDEMKRWGGTAESAEERVARARSLAREVDVRAYL